MKNQIAQRIYDWCVSNPDIMMLSHSDNNWTIMDKNFSFHKNLEELLEGQSTKKIEFKEFCENLDMAASKRQWKLQSLHLDARTMEKHLDSFFYGIYDRLNEDDKNLFVGLGERLFYFSNWIKLFSCDKELISRYMKIKPLTITPLLDHHHVTQIMQIVNQNFSNDKHDDLIFDFLSQRTNQAKRIETQVIIKKALKKQTPRFAMFLNKIVEQNDYLSTKAFPLAFNIDKNAFYLFMNSKNKAASKSQIKDYLRAIIYYFDNKEKKRLRINDCTVINDNSRKHYTLVFDCYEKNPLINHIELFMSVANDAHECISLRYNERDEFFKSATSKYFLSNLLEEKDEPVKIRKI